ncbi:MAG: DUF3604 domain-containing protein [Pseudomonadota bacterium]
MANAFKILGTVLLLLLLVLLGLFFWVRYEFARSERPDNELERWMDVTVESLADRALVKTPCLQQYPNKRAWFGGLHVHTRASYDATSFGSLTTANDAYRFAQGAPVTLALRGDPPDYIPPTVQISSPMDFMAVTDHASALGETRLCWQPDSEGYATLPCRLYRGEVQLPVEERLQPLMRLVTFAIFGKHRSARVCGPDGALCRAEAVVAWRENQLSAEAHLDRSEHCQFTTFHAYEYTLAEDSSNLHRNVFFKSSTIPQAPMSATDAPRADLLWQWLDEVCISGNEQCDAIAIPHNSNWSSGRMWFPPSNLDLPEDERVRLGKLRARIEPLAEIMQVKGDSECRNGIPSVLGAADEFCDFEKLRLPSEQIPDCGEQVGSGGMMLSGCVSRYSYVRYALTAGLAERAKLGFNPFQFGIIAATDTHNGTPTPGIEKGSLGSHGSDRDVQNRLLGQVDVPGDIARGSPVRYNPGGIAGVYAHENSRNALFEAMRRRETFGTSGPRIQPRLFAGTTLDASLCATPDMLSKAYAQGVPMGGELTGRLRQSPVFLVSASADPNSVAGALQRIQIIKGWIDRQGQTHQAVYEVAGDPDNGASVDPNSCEVSGTGFQQLCSVWQDPDFASDVAAVYYARVLENPSCRWSHYDCLSLPEDERPDSCSDPELPWQIQERAWTSPIWYLPDA